MFPKTIYWQKVDKIIGFFLTNKLIFQEKNEVLNKNKTKIYDFIGG